MPGHVGTLSLKKSHDIVILSFCNIVKGQANYFDDSFQGAKAYSKHQDVSKILTFVNNIMPNDIRANR